MLLSLFTLNVSAQQNDKRVERETETIQLDTVSLVANQQSFENLVCDIVLDENFKYKKALRKSKLTKRQYTFSDIRISETDILKQFKRAARRSESTADFIGYFYNKDMDILEKLNGNDIRLLYLTFHKGTLSEYFQELESAFGTIH